MYIKTKLLIPAKPFSGNIKKTVKPHQLYILITSLILTLSLSFTFDLYHIKDILLMVTYTCMHMAECYYDNKIACGHDYAL